MNTPTINDIKDFVDRNANDNNKRYNIIQQLSNLDMELLKQNPILNISSLITEIIDKFKELGYSNGEPYETLKYNIVNVFQAIFKISRMSEQYKQRFYKIIKQ